MELRADRRAVRGRATRRGSAPGHAPVRRGARADGGRAAVVAALRTAAAAHPTRPSRGRSNARSSTSPPCGCRSPACTPPGCPAAGVPWFMTIFGRDTLITCLQTLLLGPDLARTALHALAELQAVSDDPAIDAEPGKIVHELRTGTRGRQLVLALLRIGRCHAAVPRSCSRRCGAGPATTPSSSRCGRRRWRRWGGSTTRADLDGDGFVEFSRRAPGGLEVQSWKDSWDSQRFADGRVATPPIAAAEVQGYVFDAKTRLAEIALVVWRDRELAARLEHEAAVLSQRFDRAFWVERGGYYALALDRDKASGRQPLLQHGSAALERDRAVASRRRGR